MNKLIGKTDAQKRASKKWEKKFKQRIIRIPYEKDLMLVELAKKKSESINGLLIRIIDEEIKRNSK